MSYFARLVKCAIALPEFLGRVSKIREIAPSCKLIALNLGKNPSESDVWVRRSRYLYNLKEIE
ncbi:MAG: hypothetical protein SAJ37_01520 [Oscillatoria sp. PMC 1068.18]|nr:hypothetical protein [Oscillatoria sp. PMC 1076.18]MEC4987401.1 hypothetical protein [Oscillatoria sp. PMC 1068.18]